MRSALFAAAIALQLLPGVLGAQTPSPRASVRPVIDTIVPKIVPRSARGSDTPVSSPLQLLFPRAKSQSEKVGLMWLAQGVADGRRAEDDKYGFLIPGFAGSKWFHLEELPTVTIPSFPSPSNIATSDRAAEPDVLGPRATVTDARIQAPPTSSYPGAGAIPIEAIAGAVEPTILLRAKRDVGLAAFRIGLEMLIVLDAPINFQAPGPDVSAVFSRLTSRVTQDATVIRIPNGGSALRLARDSRGWLVTAGPSWDGVAAIVPQLISNGISDASMRLVASSPSRVVVVMNPQTGERLLVGTQNSAGEAVFVKQSLVQFTFLPTLQGVVVAAISDDIWLRRETEGFTLSGGPHADASIISFADSQDPKVPLGPMASKMFNFANETPQALTHRLNSQMLSAGSAPVLARASFRLRVAETMVALGLDVEAQSVLDIATADDPTVKELPRAIGLRAIAAVLAHRFADAEGLADPRLSGTTEIDLWRALLQVVKHHVSSEDARNLASGLPLLLGYPHAMRDRLLPETLEAMAMTGEAAAAQAALISFPDDRDLDLARGIVLEVAGNARDALRIYDDVASRAGRLPRYKALVRAIELKLKTGELDAKSGAAAFDRLLLAWRGPQQEISLRLRIADLRRQLGQWQEALGVLRDGRIAFPDNSAQLDTEAGAIFIAFLDNEAARHMQQTEFVSLYDQNLDIVKDMKLTDEVGLQLVDRLDGFGLSGRAEPIMSRLVAQSIDPVRRANLGSRLASLRIALNNPTGAIAALSATAPPVSTVLNAEVRQTRELLYAHAESERGNKDIALRMLGALDTPEADEMRADIYTGRGDWQNVVSALNALEHKRIVNSNPTDAQQTIIMRLVVAATLGGDQATLDRLGGQYGGVMAKGNSAALFRVLTSAPVQGIEDLPRALEEIELLEKLPDRVASGGRS